MPSVLPPKTPSRTPRTPRTPVPHQTERVSPLLGLGPGVVQRRPVLPARLRLEPSPLRPTSTRRPDHSNSRRRRDPHRLRPSRGYNPNTTPFRTSRPTAGQEPDRVPTPGQGADVYGAVSPGTCTVRRPSPRTHHSEKTPFLRRTIPPGPEYRAHTSPKNLSAVVDLSQG